MAEQGQEVVIVAADGTEHVFPPGFDPKRAAQIVKQGLAPTPPASGSNLDRLASLLPTAGGMVGGMAGGIPGAALGGAAGEGYGQLASHAGELWPAIKDVARNTFSQPGATLKGAAQGAMQGAKDSGIEGAIQALYELGGKVVSAGLSYGGRAIYRGYLKPSLSAQLISDAHDIVETGIREAIPVTEAGLAKAQGLISTLQGEVDRILKTTPGDVNLSDVANKVRAFAKKTYYIPGKPSADFEAAMKVADELDQHAALPRTPGAPVPTQTTSPILNAQGRPVVTTQMVPGPPVVNPNVDLPAANTVKRGLDASIGDNNFGVERGATKTTQKVARFQTRQAIETLAPKVGPLNDRESQLIDLANAIEKATGREGNRNALFGVPTMVAATTGAAELAASSGRYAAGASALAIRMGLTPAFATRAAIIAARLGDRLPGTAVADIARAAVQAVSQSEQQ